MRNTLGRAGGILIRQVGALVIVVAVCFSLVGCTPSRGDTVRLVGTPYVSLDEGVGEVLLREPGSFQGAPLDTLTRITIEPGTRVEMDDDRRIRAANMDDSELPEYLGGFTLVEIEAQQRGADLVAVDISRHAPETDPYVFETWPSRCGTEPAVFVGVLGASSGQVDNGRFSPSFEFTTLEFDDSAPDSWHMITAWSAPGLTVPVDGMPLDVSAEDSVFSEMMDQKLVRLELRREGDRWYLESVQTLRDAETAWPPGL